MCYLINMKIKSDIYLGDASNILKKIENDTIDLIVTSPHIPIKEKIVMEGFL